jgi:hypothetical protein
MEIASLVLLCSPPENLRPAKIIKIVSTIAIQVVITTKNVEKFDASG